MSSTHEDVITRVLELAESSTAGFSVYDGFRPQMGTKFIAAGDIEDALVEYHAMRAGAKPRQETYDLILHIVSIQPGESPTPSRTAVSQAWEQLSLTIATDPSLGLDPTLVVSPGEFETRIRFDDNTRGWRGELIAKVNVRARRTG